MNKKIIITTLLSFLLALPQLASAHFHYGLKVESHLQANAQQQLDAIKMTWVYDTEVSTLMLQNEKDTKKMGKNLIKDLAELQYFTTLKLNTQALETMPVRAYQLEELKQAEGNKLKLSLTLPLKKPVSLNGKNTLEIIHEDATGSAIIYYEAVADVSLDKNLNNNCRVQIKEKDQVKEGEAPQRLRIICSV